MKKILIMLSLIFVSLLAIGQVTEPPTDWGEIVSNPTVWFLSFSGIALLGTFVTSVLVGWWKVNKPFVKQLIAWVIGIILMLISFLFKFGYAAEFTIWMVLYHGFAAGLASNGWSNIPTIKGILDAIEGMFKKE